VNKLVQFDAFSSAWPTVEEGETRARIEGGAGSGESLMEKHAPSDATVAEAGTRTHDLIEHGRETMEHALAFGFAWLIGMGIGFAFYMNGYGVANALMRIPPLRWIHTWL